MNAMPPDSPPLISVIVVCKNPGPRLETALASVWDQDRPAPELIVIDGGSTDGTRAWLESRRARITVLISEPDRGVYDAMNKGVAAARGEWLLFLGADDQIIANLTLGEMQGPFALTGSGIVVGETLYHDGRVYGLASRPNPIARNFVHHQGAFYRRSLFAQHGLFDASLAIMADYEFNLRLWQSGVSFTALPLRVAACGIRGLSDAGRWLGYREEIAVRHRRFPAWRCWLWDSLSLLRFLRKKFVVTLSPRHG